jgi:hypothetical protein
MRKRVVNINTDFRKTGGAGITEVSSNCLQAGQPGLKSQQRYSSYSDWLYHMLHVPQPSI